MGVPVGLGQRRGGSHRWSVSADLRCIVFCDEFSTYSITIDFSTSIARNRVNNEPALGNSGTSQPFATPGLQAADIESSIWYEPNCSADSLAADLVRDGKDARLRDLGMGLKHEIYFSRLHLETSAIDFILDSAGQPNSTEVINDAAISRTKPAIDDYVCSEVGAIEITRCQAWRLYNDLAFAGPLNCAAVILNACHTTPGLSYEAVHNGVNPGGSPGNPIGGFGHAIAVNHLGARPRCDLRPQFGGKGR